MPAACKLTAVKLVLQFLYSHQFQITSTIVKKVDAWFLPEFPRQRTRLLLAFQAALKKNWQTGSTRQPVRLQLAAGAMAPSCCDFVNRRVLTSLAVAQDRVVHAQSLG